MPHPIERDLLRLAKPQLHIHNDEALNAEAPPELLDEDVTPLPAFFIRNNGSLPPAPAPEAPAWTLSIDGEVERPLRLTVDELRRQFETVTVRAVLECAGNGRAGFGFPTAGLQWNLGAVGCADWTGVRLADLLRAARVHPNAVYVAHHSPDLASDGRGPALSRGLPIEKALAPESLVAFTMNGEPLSLLHGAPLRVVAPGYPGSAWQKWLTQLSVLDHEHDGVKMTGTDYRLPRTPVRPGDAWDTVPFDVITDMPARAMITRPAAGFRALRGSVVPVRGVAWSGQVPLARVDLSVGQGTHWEEAELESGLAGHPFAWRRFHGHVTMPDGGTTQIMARATDFRGRSQPLDSAPWNPRGYCNNGVHRVPGVIASS